MSERVLYLVICGAGPASQIEVMVRLARADAVVVAPATYNTINKWAAGVADNYVLTLARAVGHSVSPLR